ncbi:MAG: M48 family metallopeptidase [Methanobacterium sp.]
MLSKTTIHGLEVSYEIIHRDIKFPRLELKSGILKVIVPKNYQNPDALVKKHYKWIYSKLELIEKSRINSKAKIDVEMQEDELRLFIFSLVDEFSKELQVCPKEIRLRKMVSKWGSCSTKKTLTFNRCLKYLPKCMISYVVFHEIVHLIEKKHNTNFWSIIATRFKDYEERETELFDYWFKIQSKEYDN